MSKLNMWDNESRCGLEEEIWPELGAEGGSKVESEHDESAQQTVYATSALDQHEYPELGQKIKAGGPDMSKDIKQYYNAEDIMQTSRSHKVKSRDPVTLDLGDIIKATSTLNLKQKVPAKGISKTESSSRFRGRVKHSMVKLPSSMEKAIHSERELSNMQMTKEIDEIGLDELTLNQKVEEDNSKIRRLHVYGLISYGIQFGLLETLKPKGDLRTALAKLNVPLSSIVGRESIESVIERVNALEVTGDDFHFFKNLTSNKKNKTLKSRIPKKFRGYRTNVVTPGLSSTLHRLIPKITGCPWRVTEKYLPKGWYKQDRMYVGFKEVEEYILVGKVKFVIIAADVDTNIKNGILDKTIDKFIDLCKQNQVAICYGLESRELKKFARGRKIVSVVGIADYSGAEDTLEEVLRELIKAKNKFNTRSRQREKIVNIAKFESDSSVSQRIDSLLKTASSMT